MDSIASHTAFAKECGAHSFPLLSDSRREVARSYGVLNEEEISRHATFLIDPQGIIRWSKIYQHSIEIDPDRVKRDLFEIRRHIPVPGRKGATSGSLLNTPRPVQSSSLAVPTQIVVRLWGTRGSIASPGPQTVRYGGNTSCVEVSSNAGHLFIFDCGTGVRQLGDELLRRSCEPIIGQIFLTHSHLDHIQGFPFFRPAFNRGNHFTIYGCAGFEHSLEQILANQMEYRYFPVSLHQLAAEINFVEICEGTVSLQGAMIDLHRLSHPSVTSGYRLQLGGHTIIYCTDQEPVEKPEEFTAGKATSAGAWPADMKLAEWCRGADVLIHDAQYTEQEYREKIGWGHSPIESVVDLAAAAQVHTLILFHHDPAHSDDVLDQLLVSARERGRALSPDLHVTVGYEGMELILPVPQHHEARLSS